MRQIFEDFCLSPPSASSPLIDFISDFKKDLCSSSNPPNQHYSLFLFTIHYIGDITTANAIDEEAFGKVLKNVTIGTVKAGGSVFGAKAFIWGNVADATLLSLIHI